MSKRDVERLSKIMADKIGHGMSEKCEVYAEIAERYFVRKSLLPRCFGESPTEPEAAEYCCHNCPFNIDCRA